MKNQRGFTLVELLISVAILAIITGAIITLVAKNQERYAAEEDYNVTVQNARGALDLISRYIRQAGNNPQAAVFVPFSSDGASLTMRSDLTGSKNAANPLDATGDPDGQLTAAYEVITVRFGSGSIFINVGYGEEVMATNVNNLQFTFYTSSGATTVDPAQAFSINVRIEALSARNDPETRKKNAITLSETIFIRAKNYTPFT